MVVAILTNVTFKRKALKLRVLKISVTKPRKVS